MTQLTFEQTFVIPFPERPSIQQILDAMKINAQFGDGTIWWW